MSTHLVSDPKAPIPTHFFVHLVIKRGEEFLLIQENKPGHPWYLPAGRVEPGEGFMQAAARETLEEAGIAIVVQAIVRLEHLPSSQHDTRMRMILLASPADERPLKSIPDQHSLGARWVRLEDLGGLHLRHPEVEGILRLVASGPAIAPIGILRREGEPYD